MAQKVDMKALAMIKFESNTVENQKLFDEMYEAGFVMLFFGLESANDRILNLIEKGTDKATEQKVLEDASCAGIWNHTYMFFGFPTEEREEAEETVEFIVDNSEARSGNIHSVGQSTFTLEKDSAVFHNPSKFSIDRIIKKPERDLSIMYDYDIQVGMGKDEINEVYEKFNRVIDECYPSSKIWKFLSREHFLLYLDKFGKEEIMNMAGDEELVDA